MTVYGILLLVCVAALRLIPEALTMLTAYDPRYMDWDKKTRGRILLSLLVISSSIHLIAFLIVHRLLLGDWDIVKTMGSIAGMRTAYQDMGYFASSFLLCMGFGIMLGLVLHRILHVLEKGYSREAMGRRQRILFLMLISVTGAAAAACYCLQSSGFNKIRINEICSNDETIMLDVDGNIRLSDYVELYNGGKFPCRIDRLYLSDDINALKKYKIPAGTIKAGGYMLILVDANKSFGISRYGETVYLSDEDGNIIDRIDCIGLRADAGYCRMPDGSDFLSSRECTPGWSNNWSQARLSPPSFSRESGFYGADFDLAISAEEGLSVFYTLDGSEPSAESIPYEGAIRITDAGGRENVWSMREDISAGFLTDEIGKIGEGAYFPGYKAPDYPVDKCTVIRAVCVDGEGNKSPVASATYFVGLGDKKGYDGLNVLSVMTDPDSLFDHEKGIYVLGSAYDAFRESDNPAWMESDWKWWSANYTQKGRDWEREACLQFFDKGGRLVLSKDAGIRIQGGRTRGQAPKSLNFYARKEYDGKGRFGADLFGSGYEPKRMTLFTGADDSIAKIKDYMMSCTMGGRDFSMMEFSPYAMFLDGEYWGCYWLTEKYDEHYFEFHYGVDPDNVVMIKHGTVEVGTEEDLALYEKMRSDIIGMDLSVEANYDRACRIVDMDSLIDYYAAEIYIGRHGDWPSGNFALWRTREKGGGAYSDGKWRWILFDVNSGSMESRLAEQNTLADVMEADELFAGLMENAAFREQLKEVMLDMARTEFLPARTDAFIADYRENMEAALELEYERFYGRGNQKTTELGYVLDDMRQFFHGRYSYITGYFGTEFDSDFGSGFKWTGPEEDGDLDEEME